MFLKVYSAPLDFNWCLSCDSLLKSLLNMYIWAKWWHLAFHCLYSPHLDFWTIVLVSNTAVILNVSSTCVYKILEGLHGYFIANPMKILIDIPDIVTINIHKCGIYLCNVIALSSFVRFAYHLQYLWTVIDAMEIEAITYSLVSILELFLHFPSWTVILVNHWVLLGSICSAPRKLWWLFYDSLWWLRNKQIKKYSAYFKCNV